MNSRNLLANSRMTDSLLLKAAALRLGRYGRFAEQRGLQWAAADTARCFLADMAIQQGFAAATFEPFRAGLDGRFVLAY
jgi:hypothetical protein